MSASVPFPQCLSLSAFLFFLSVCVCPKGGNFTPEYREFNLTYFSEGVAEDLEYMQYENLHNQRRRQL